MLASMKVSVLSPIALLAAVILLSGCEKTIKPEGAEQVVVDVVSDHTGFHPTDVSCPDGVEAKVGGMFDCHFTGPDGDYVAQMTIDEVNGSDVRFQVRSAPVDQK